MITTEHPIRRIRRSLGLTVEQLAARAEVASATVYRAERGIGEPSRMTRKALARVLRVDPDELIEVHDQETDTASTARGRNLGDGTAAGKRSPAPSHTGA